MFQLASSEEKYNNIKKVSRQAAAGSSPVHAVVQVVKRCVGGRRQSVNVAETAEGAANEHGV
jgi:hypothetical protein